jgi:hypothetical protein
MRRIPTALLLVVMGAACGNGTTVAEGGSFDAAAGETGVELADRTAPDAVNDAGSPDAVEGDAWAENECTEAGSGIIEASKYDQSCTEDSDCTAVITQGCFPCAITCDLPGAAINVSAASEYQMALAETPAWLMVQANPQIGCFCPAAGPGACCRAGMCQVGTVCAPVDAGE